jgi:ribosomal protein L11 methyltransferase
MPFLQVTLLIGSADPEPFEDALMTAGALSLTLQDAEDNPVLEPAPGTTPLWPSVRLQAVFNMSVDPEHVRDALGQALAGNVPPLEFEQLADRAWEREWLKAFKPMRFGRRLWVCPAGMRPDLEPEHGTNVCFVDLDPGLAFGTGTHPTTAMCLDWLDGASLDGMTLIDYGSGSGVLAIAALRLGAASALAVDIDPQALLATRDNAGRNGVADRLAIQGIDAPLGGQVDILLANILAEPLLALAPTFANAVKHGGHIVLSGILSSQADQVASGYAPWFDISPATKRDDWVRLDGVRQRN